VDLVPRSVEEAGVDEHHPLAGGKDPGAQVSARASLIVHHADLGDVALKAQCVLHQVEQAHRQRGLFGAVDPFRKRMRIAYRLARLKRGSTFDRL